MKNLSTKVSNVKLGLTNTFQEKHPNTVIQHSGVLGWWNQVTSKFNSAVTRDIFMDSVTPENYIYFSTCALLSVDNTTYCGRKII